MGARGPTPRPAWKKRLEGNPGKRPIKEETHKAPPGPPTCPTWLDEGAKAEWARLAPQLERLRLLSALDRFTFAAYCTSYSTWVDCEKHLIERGRSYVTPGGRIKERPEVALAHQALRNTLMLARELGLSPATRARLSIQHRLDEEEDEWDSLLD